MAEHLAQINAMNEKILKEAVGNCRQKIAAVRNMLKQNLIDPKIVDDCWQRFRVLGTQVAKREALKSFETKSKELTSIDMLQLKEPKALESHLQVIEGFLKQVEPAIQKLTQGH